MAVDARAMPGRLPATVTLSVAAHAGLVCLVMLLAASRPAPRLAIRTLITSVVSLETPPPTPPPVPVDIETPPPPVAAAPPRTAPQPVARASTPQPTPAAQAPAAPASPSPVLAAPQGAEAPALADGPPSDAPVVAAAHAGPATAPVGVESAPAAAEGPMVDVGAYLSNLRDRVSRHRRYPEMALQLGLEGVVEVAVVVRPDGTLAAAPSIADSSGHDLLDEEALHIVARAAPFPPLTGHHEPVRLRVPVNFQLD